MTAAAADTRSENSDETPADTPADGRTDGRIEGRTRRGGRWIEQWDPEDETLLAGDGGADRAGGTWSSPSSPSTSGSPSGRLWSVMVLFMGPEYGIDPAGKFFLVAMPTLVGGGRCGCPYTFAVARFGGRNWTVISAAMLLVPTRWPRVVMEPGTSYTTFLLVAALAGVGGGNFASSMTNINSFYPAAEEGLGARAERGRRQHRRAGRSSCVGLLVIGTAGAAHPRIVLGRLHPADRGRGGARGAVHGQPGAGDERHRRGQGGRAGRRTPGSCRCLYIGTFGSFIGYSFAFGLVLQNQFAPHAAAGRVAHLHRPAARLADPAGRRAAGRPVRRRPDHAVELRRRWAVGHRRGRLRLGGSESLPVFLVGFIALFVLTRARQRLHVQDDPRRSSRPRRCAAGWRGEEAAAYGRRLSGAAMGLIGAVGALGGLGINLAFRQSFLSARIGHPGVRRPSWPSTRCAAAVTWAVYLRPAARRRARPADGRRMRRPRTASRSAAYAEV